ncbi:MAG: hypothetical protein ACD_72C00194G0003 [uncultured bacterium]|nr:MAG: hypothetical protein ACD_72C00194G0003 [uncultured bacterium]
MLDGIDGCGKSTVMGAWKKYLTDQGNALFDLKKYFKENDRYPEVSETKAYDFITSSEPADTGVGKVIREELINKNNNYSPSVIAEAYSLDRLILYKKIMIPCLAQDKIIIQDRGVSSSLAYQTSMDGLDFDMVCGLAGNALALANRPDYLVIVDTEPEIAIQRITSRFDKQDDSIFEHVEILKKIRDQYHSEKFQKIFTDRGTKIVYLNGNEKIDIMNEQAISWLKTIL